MKSLLTLTTALFATVNILGPLRAEENWPRFGGPEGNGRSTETTLPVKWDASSIVWKTQLKGEGQSSVINWGDRLFLTSATDKGAKRWMHCLD